jgi:large subunit ribosomal protein L32e
LEILEEKAYKARAKPVLSEATQALLLQRAARRAERPAFRRQEWFRYKRLGTEWRRPRGHHSKLRRHLGYRPSMPSAGYRGPRTVRGLHPSGFREVLVHRPAELDGVNPETHAARIAHSVGTRKRVSIQERADELGIRILNRVVE